MPSVLAPRIPAFLPPRSNLVPRKSPWERGCPLSSVYWAIIEHNKYDMGKRSIATRIKRFKITDYFLKNGFAH